MPQLLVRFVFKSVNLINFVIGIFYFSLEQLYLNKNCLSSLFDNGWQYHESEVTCCKPFQNLHCLLLGNIMLSS